MAARPAEDNWPRRRARRGVEDARRRFTAPPWRSSRSSMAISARSSCTLTRAPACASACIWS